MITLLLALVVGFPASAAGSACTLLVRGVPLRPEPAVHVVLRATADSASDGVYYTDSTGRFIRQPGRGPREVYGQVMEVVSAEGESAEQIRQAGKVLVVWWALGASCRRALPVSALGVPRGEVFIPKAPRSHGEWSTGLPTYDVDPGRDYFYSPLDFGVRYHGDSLPRMPISAFLELFAVLPTQSAEERDPVRALDPLLSWGAADSSRWKVSPARYMLCDAKIRQLQRSVPECEPAVPPGP